MSATMRTLLRFVAGAVVPTVLFFLVGSFGPRVQGTVFFLLVMAAFGLIGGALMRSWWSILLVPGAFYATIVLGGILRSEFFCRNCPPAETYPNVLLMIFGVMALGAAVGTLLAKGGALAVRRLRQ